MWQSNLSKAVLVLFFLFLIIAGIVLAKEFLLPLVFGILLATLLLKRTAWMEQKGMPKWLSAFLAIFMVVLIFTTAVGLIGWQISDLDEEISKFSSSLEQIERNVKQFIKETLGMSMKDANKLVNEATQTDKAPQIATAVLATMMDIFINCVLALVYTFLFLYFRGHLKKFILIIVPNDQRENAEKIIHDSMHVSYGYISGLARMIACLWLMYSIGFSIVGIEHPIMFALICGTLEIVPFAGNLVGTSLALIMAVVQGGGTEMIVGVIIVYAIVQFVQTYLLEPLVIGTEVNLNPLFTIIAIVLGEILWGIPGMIVAIPVLGMVKILCDNVTGLRPYGFLLGLENGHRKRTQSFWQKIKERFSNR